MIEALVWRLILRPFLFLLDPEAAHRLTLWGLPYYTFVFYHLPRFLMRAAIVLGFIVLGPFIAMGIIPLLALEAREGKW